MLFSRDVALGLTSRTHHCSYSHRDISHMKKEPLKVIQREQKFHERSTALFVKDATIESSSIGVDSSSSLSTPTVSAKNGDEQLQLNPNEAPVKEKKTPRKEIIDIDHSSRLLLRLDGFEPYVVVTAITGTSSFGALSQAHDLPDTSTLLGIGMNSILILSTTLSSLLGIYSLGVFSLVLLYSKAALGRNDATDVYPVFLESTGIFRYRAFISFRWSLSLFVLNIILFSLTFLPSSLQGIATVGALPLLYSLYSDWDAMVVAAAPIFRNDDSTDIEEDAEGEEEPPHHLTSNERKSKTLSKTAATAHHSVHN